MVILLMIFFIAIFIIQVPPLVKAKMWGELAAFVVFMIIGMALSIPQVLGIKLPNPDKAIEAIFEPFYNFLK
jgi:uncharacterized membrane protein YoaT (DUF817 family)